jgi:hypothetical protein
VLPLVVLGLWRAGCLLRWAAVPLGVFTLLLPTAFTGACIVYDALRWSTCRVRPGRTTAPAAHLGGR